MSKKIQILQITAGLTPQGSMLFGLGSDGKIYVWSSKDNGQWLPNWTAPAPEVGPAITVEVQAPAKKKAVKKGGKR